MKLDDYLEQQGMTQLQFAKLMGVTQGLVWQWLNGRTTITAERAIQIERATNNMVTREDLRPDLFAVT